MHGQTKFMFTNLVFNKSFTFFGYRFVAFVKPILRI